MDYMKIINSRWFFFVFVIGAIAAWEFLRTPPPPHPRPADVQKARQAAINSADNQAELEKTEPWLERETKYARGVRERSRTNIVRSIKRIEDDWWKICEVNGHRTFAGAFEYYFEQREMQIRNYTGSWGEAGKRFITDAWNSGEDERVVQLMRDIYAKGYFRIEEFGDWKRESAARILNVGPPPPRSCLP
jgi:hypothetical protein